jgi:hypothetical protein
MEETSAVKVGLKYCGGCNPTFDRVAFVRDLTASLDFAAQWVSFEDENISCLLIVNGCEIACADPKEFESKGLRVFSISSDEPGIKENFPSFILGGSHHD